MREQVSNGAVVVDVREPEEWAAGHIPGAKHVPKSYLESRIEGAVPDRAQHVILYCASGNRSAWATRTLIEDLGYEHVESMTGGFTLWKDRGYEVEMPRTLTAEQRERYSRHLLLPEVGPEGQQKLLDAKVLLLGAGGLGSPAALYLAAAGVGTLGIVDNDVVDLSNLQRQVIHSTERIGVPKVDSAEQTINALNPDVKVEKYHRPARPREHHGDPARATTSSSTASTTSRPATCSTTPRCGSQIPVVSAAILGFEGQLSVFKPYDGPCYRCLFPVPPPAELAPSCGANGVLGRAARHDGPAAGDRGHQADPRRGRPADRPPADVRRARGHVHRGQGPARSRVPDLLARARRDLRSRRWACSPTTRRSAPAPTRVPRSMATVRIPPVLRPSVGGEKELTADGASVGEILRAVAEATRTPSRSCSPPTASSTATSTSTSTTRTCACSDGLDTAVGESDTLVILPAMAGGRPRQRRLEPAHRAGSTTPPGRSGAFRRRYRRPSNDRKGARCAVT